MKRTIIERFDILIVFFIGEGDASIKKLSFAQLNEQVRRYRAALQHIGVTVGDRVAGKTFIFVKKYVVHLIRC